MTRHSLGAAEDFLRSSGSSLLAGGALAALVNLVLTPLLPVDDLFRRTRIACFLLTSALTAALAAAPAGGQSSALQYSFSNPGARSMGFGGAFAALADDATAAFANPAGLVQLTEPEVSIEGRSWSYSTPYFNGGRFGGPPTGIGLDTTRGARTARSDTERDGLSFLAFVHPGKSWSFALYRHQLADFEFAGETQGIFIGDGRVPDIRGATEIDLVTHAAAVAYQVSEELSLGLGLTYFDGFVRLIEEDYLPDDDTPESFYGPSSFLPERLVESGVLILDDEDWGLTAGLLWSFAERWSLGAFYREGPELDGDVTSLRGPAFPEDLPGVPATGSVPIAFPDVSGLGVAFRSRGGRLTVSLEADRIAYSAVTDSLREGLRRLNETATVSGTLDDGLEIHLGAEYVFLDLTPILAVRWGVWLDPDHVVSPGSSPDGRIRPGDDEVHAAVGLGVAFERFQLDLGADVSDSVDTVSLSAIYRF